MVQLVRGETAPLHFTMEKNFRISIGLSWDARADKASIVEKIQGQTMHDLDLSCYVYDKDGDFIDLVTPNAEESMDDSGAIYHSGDHQSGEGDGDDEAISVELRKLPEDVKAIFFLVETGSQHFMGDMDSISMRIADGMTNNNLVDVTLDKGLMETAIAYAFAKIYRDKASPTEWMVQFINEFPDTDRISNWGDFFKRYLLD